MSCRCTAVVWLLCCLLFSLAAPSLAEPFAKCDQARSALTRSVIEKYVLPHAKWAGFSFSKACPLHPDRDMGSELKVEGFGKDVCLADLCEALHCDRLAEPATEEEKAALKPHYQHETCHQEEVSALRAKCRKIAEVCFLGEGKEYSHWMWDVVAHHICAAHSCDEEWREDMFHGLHHSKPWKRWYNKIMGAYVTFILVGLYVLVWGYYRFFVGLTNEQELTRLGAESNSWWPFGRKARKAKNA